MADQRGRSGEKASSRRTVPGATGRTTAKGTTPASRASTGRGRMPPASGRYTPPIPHEKKVSPRWVPALMFALLGLGVLAIILNYLGVLPGGSDNRYLLGGLAAITAGFVTATQYR